MIVGGGVIAKEEKMFVACAEKEARVLSEDKKKPALRVGGPLWGKRMRSHKLEARILQKSPVWPFAMAYPGLDLSCLLRGLQREMSSDQGPSD